MVLPDTALMVFPDVDGVIITAGWGAGQSSWKMMRNRQLRSLHIQYVVLKSKYHHHSIYG